MSWPDCVNGVFELSGAYFVWLSVAKLRRDRQVRGVDWRTTGFFAAWGVWNLGYYPSLDQWASFVGAWAVTVLNLWYLVLLLWYRRDRPHPLEAVSGTYGNYGGMRVPERRRCRRLGTSVDGS